MGKDLEKGLLALGLEEREAQVFHSVLHLKDPTAYKVAKDTGIASRSVYDILHSLHKRGLIVFYNKDNSTHYQVASLSHLSKLVEERSDMLTAIIPSISGLKKEQTFDSVIYTGKGGLRAIMDDILGTLNKGEELLGLGDNGKVGTKYLPASLQRWHEERVEGRINQRSIFNTVPEAIKRLPQVRKLALLKARVTPIERQSYSGVWLYGDKLLLTDMQDDPVLILIQNSEIKSDFEAQFNFFWQHAKRGF